MSLSNSARELNYHCMLLTNRSCFTMPIQVLKAELTTGCGLQFGVVV
jgi:hypothetical protein